jgi:SAM-dependent methyltransferase
VVGLSAAVIWHDVECGAYAADLPLWRELAERAGGPVLELGAGTGRVALDLAARGHQVTALDVDAELLAELAARAERAGVAVETVVADAREAHRERAAPPLGRGPAPQAAAQRGPQGRSAAPPAVPARSEPERRFALVVAPMQLLQIVGGPAGRAAVLRGVARALRPGGLFAAAVAALDDAVAPENAEPPLPDVGERDGWVYSSLPLDVRPESGGVAVERLRQVVSPEGRLSEERHTQRLEELTPDQLEREASEAGLEPEARHEIASTPDHVGSEVVVCRR